MTLVKGSLKRLGNAIFVTICCDRGSICMVEPWLCILPTFAPFVDDPNANLCPDSALLVPAEVIFSFVFNQVEESRSLNLEAAFQDRGGKLEKCLQDLETLKTLLVPYFTLHRDRCCIYRTQENCSLLEISIGLVVELQEFTPGLQVLNLESFGITIAVMDDCLKESLHSYIIGSNMCTCYSNPIINTSSALRRDYVLGYIQELVFR